MKPPLKSKCYPTHVIIKKNPSNKRQNEIKKY